MAIIVAIMKTARYYRPVCNTGLFRNASVSFFFLLSSFFFIVVVMMQIPIFRKWYIQEPKGPNRWTYHLCVTTKVLLISQGSVATGRSFLFRHVWRRGPCVAWDATCPDTYAQSAIHESCVQAGSAALKTELNKSRKYAEIIAGVDFIPFAIRD